MKLEKLKIHNIASIADAEIDFTSEPLVDEPVFLIYGPTGSGKSTILDAVCLALYNRVPRLENAPNESFVDRQSTYSGGDDGMVRITDPRMLLRRNTPSCKIELTFRDNLNRQFTAEWSCAHAHKRVDRNVMPVSWRLLNDRGEELTAKIRETAKALEDIIGLTFEQFRRTTMLAQGEFSRFLTSDANSKSEILEKLTGTEIYSRLGIRIAERAAAARNDVAALETLVNSAKLLTDEELATMSERIVSINAQSNEIALEQRKTTELTEAIKANLAASEKLRQLTAELDREKQEANSDAFRRLSAEVSTWDATDALRSQLIQKKTLLSSLAALRTKIADSAQFERCESERLDLLDTLDSRRKTFASTIDDLSHLTEWEPLFNNIPLLESTISSLTSAKKKIDENLAAIERNNVDRSKLLSTLDSQKRTKEKLQGEIDVTKNKIASSDEKLRKLDRPKLDLMKMGNDDAIARHREIKTAAQLFINSLGTVAELEGQLQSTAAKAEEANLRATADNLACKMAKTVFEQAKKLYDKQKSSTEDYLIDLRHQLSEGDNCPLCGQKIATLTDTAAFESMLTPLRRECELRESELADATKRLNDSTALAKGLAKTLEAVEKLLDKQRSILANAANGLAALDPEQAYFNGASFNGERFDSECSELEKEATRLNQFLAQCDNLAKEVAAANKSLTLQFHQLSAIDTKITELTVDASRIDADIASRGDVIAGLKADVEQFNKKIATIVSFAPLFTAMAENGEFTRLIGDAKRQLALKNELTEKSDTLRNAIAQLESTLSRIDAHRTSILEKLPHWENRQVATLPANAEATEKQWNQLAQWLAEAEGQMMSLQRQLADIEKSLDRVSASDTAPDIAEVERLILLGADEMNRRRSLVDDQRRCLATAETRLKEAEEKLAETVKALNGADTGQLESLTQLLDELKRKAESLLLEKGSLEQQIRSDRTTREAHARDIAKLAELRQVENNWHRMNQLFGSNDGRRMRNIAQSWVLEQLAAHANFYLRQLSSRYELCTQPGRLSLLVRDNDAGGDMRPAANLSGGETFVVSLALALGLPSLSGRATAMDTIFIDEGFGTLDAEVRSMVVDTLERLHQLGGRRVGLISHVDALRERIAVKIEVRRKSATLSEIAVTRQ